MSKCLLGKSYLLVLALATLNLAAGAVGALYAAPVVERNTSDQGSSHIDIYTQPSERRFFALSLAPNIELPSTTGLDVIVLFDTSATQTGAYRQKAIDTLTNLLNSVKPSTQVKLIAVDLEAHALTDTFVAADSDTMQNAIGMLKRRAPLGATNLLRALAAAAQSFSGKSNHERSVVYLGDGMSGAHFISGDEMKQMVDQLVSKRISVSSFSVGPKTDADVLAALANQTGGMLAIDDANLSPKQIAAFLASAAQATIIWPTSAVLPSQFASTYPKNVPPLRTDRDTILIGTLEKNFDGKSLAVSLNGKCGGKDVALSWTVAVAPSNNDFSFLPALIDIAKPNDGIGLVTVGSAGLSEARRIINASTAELAKLGSQAASMGNVDAATRLTDEALRLDPQDPTARTVKKVIEKQRASQPLAKVPASKAKEPASSTVSAKLGTKGVLKLEKFRNDQAPPAPADAEPAEAATAEEPGAFLESIDQQRAVMRDLINVEVENDLRAARNQMAVDPNSVVQNLKLTLDKVMRAPELEAEMRAQLRDQIETSLREANRRAAEKLERDQAVQASIAAREERQRMVASLERRQDKIKQLMDRFDSLMDEGRYALAEETAAEVADIRPDLPIAVSSTLMARQTRYVAEALEVRTLRQKGVVDTLYQVELSHIPFPDDEPIIYPSAPVWEELTQRRKKFAAVDLKKVGPAEEKITAELDRPTSLEFVETPLSDVVDYLKDLHKIEIQLDTKALEDAGAGSDTPITRKLNGISLKSALRLMLGGLDLTYVIKDEVLLITTPEKAGSELVTKVYPVADLVLPIRTPSVSGMNGMGGMGGGMGGMGGGGGGGMGGGMGGGGGGMGGGMGGMGGGGGGFFSVPDDGAAPQPGLQALAVKDDPKPKTAGIRISNPAVATEKKTTEKTMTAKKIAPIELDVPASANLAAAWFDYFQKHDDVTDASVRETARQLMKARKFSAAVAMIDGALANNYAQPWMYEALGLAMIAGGSPKPEIERALMSAVDFAESTDDLMYAAQYMARNGLEKRALEVFRQVSTIEPLRPEPLRYGLQLASRTNDLEGLKWASLGVLKQAWPNDQREIRVSADHIAMSVLEQLKSEKRTKEAAEFEAQLAQALVRDVLVKVTWTGDADVDVLVEEPSGTVCSFRNPRTTAGGVMLGDTASRGSVSSSQQGFSEVYVCPEAFTGTYKMLLRRVWGKITAGKVTVDLYTNYGAKQMSHQRQQISLGEQDSAVVFNVLKGRRNEPIAKHLVANAAANQVAVNRAILAQQVGSAANNAANLNFALSRAALEGQFPLARSAVGYQPVIITLPQGANMSTTGVISADRRYVRVTPVPFFSQIGQVTTFNIASGTSTVLPPTPPGGGGLPPPGPNFPPNPTPPTPPTP